MAYGQNAPSCDPLMYKLVDTGIDERGFVIKRQSYNQIIIADTARKTIFCLIVLYRLE